MAIHMQTYNIPRNMIGYNRTQYTFVFIREVKQQEWKKMNSMLLRPSAQQAADTFMMIWRQVIT